jgi:hypothetical protein
MNLLAMLLFGPPIMLLFASIWVLHHVAEALVKLYKWVSK